MARKPEMRLPVFDVSKQEQEGAQGYDEDHLKEMLRGERVPFNQNCDAGLYEKIRAASFHEQEPIADILERALARELARMEKERGEPYKVYEPHRIQKKR